VAAPCPGALPRDERGPFAASPFGSGPDGGSLLERIALGATLLVPVFLMHGHGIADGMMAAVDLCFVAASARARDWRWVRTPWFLLALAWWAWVLFCSLLRGGNVVQSALQLRFFVFIAALEHYALRTGPARRWMFGAVAACAAWIVANCLFQLAVGTSPFGAPRGPAGELTGPFRKARAGPPLARIMLPVLIPPAALLLERRRLGPTLGAGALLLGGLVAMVLISQRMPLALVVLGLAVCALLLRRLRPVVLVAVAAAAVLVAASAVVAPTSYQRLVVRFSQQMGDFPASHYGHLYARAYEIGRQNPWTGLGFDGFRHGCDEPRYFRPTPDAADGGGADICTQHPHNFYAEAFDNGGFPGLALFCALALAWLAPLASGLWRDPVPLRVGLFAGVLIQLWPIASTSGFSALPMGGWLFLLLGWGMAEARAVA
jgi:hypothetical protein